MIFGLLLAASSILAVNAQRICDSCGVDNESGRIVGGVEAIPNRYPWAVLITYGGGYWCGGSVINPQYVLSAAHCVTDKGVVMSTRRFGVSLGEHNRILTNETRLPVQTYGIKRFIPHENYNDRATTNDIALLLVDGTIQYNEAVGPICITDTNPTAFYSSLVGKTVKVVGWGDQASGAGQGSDVLREVDLTVISLFRCRLSYTGLSSKQICTFTEGKDSCQGDSGGPVVYWEPSSGYFTQIGLVSFGKGCGGPAPGVNTFVPAFASWIRSKVSGNYCAAI